MLIYPKSGGWIVCGLPGSHANNVNSAGSDKLTQVQFYMSTSFQPGSLLSDIENFYFYFLIWQLKPSNQKIKKNRFSTSEKACIGSWVNKFYRHGCRGNSYFILNLVGWLFLV